MKLSSFIFCAGCLAVASSIGGCAATSLVAGAVTGPPVSAATALVWSTHPDFPKQVVALEDKPLAEIQDLAGKNDVWGRFEYARRLEYGVGIDRDPVCAWVIYEYYFQSYYGEIESWKASKRLEHDPAVAAFLKNRTKDIMACIPRPSDVGPAPATERDMVVLPRAARLSPEPERKPAAAEPAN